MSSKSQNCVKNNFFNYRLFTVSVKLNFHILSLINIDKLYSVHETMFEGL